MTGEKIYRSGIVHTDTAEQVLDAFRTHISTHPPRFFGDIDSIAEFLYFQYTETNPENRRGQVPEIINTPHNLCGSHPSQQPLRGG